MSRHAPPPPLSPIITGPCHQTSHQTLEETVLLDRGGIEWIGGLEDGDGGFEVDNGWMPCDTSLDRWTEGMLETAPLDCEAYEREKPSTKHDDNSNDVNEPIEHRYSSNQSQIHSSIHI
ncbi:hypothetical protein BCR33DRAFT_719261 [Rhizoclosmatium globosum]|uniref:Uncharacterized protein n=1 Tax=Rhizoclosmatium globosum TaxID=329046 RepID=A0A1Y2C1E6_9FUNG|nr:hypothetical protein BCR33DRAFT_719261 [Rhizoclosmatium globosum]|eukprot:ORY40724.1 hypothetical protein BCR33DRAFT_719261 [Rhizoclosmatium globosum]